MWLIISHLRSTITIVYNNYLSQHFSLKYVFGGMLFMLPALQLNIIHVYVYIYIDTYINNDDNNHSNKYNPINRMG